MDSDKLTQPKDHEKKSLNFIFPIKYEIPKSLSRLTINSLRPSFATLIEGGGVKHPRYFRSG